MNSITITFASKCDHERALATIAKARAYAAKGSQLGALHLALLLKTLERAEAVSGEIDADLAYCIKGILRETDRKMDAKKDFSLMVYREGLKRAIDASDATTKTPNKPTQAAE